jgi:four helix bundle protein
MKHDSNDFKSLVVWQQGLKLVEAIYKHSMYFPKSEQFGLTNQIRRASVSILSNLAEGISRFSSKEKARFYEVSFGSATEVKAQLIISAKLGFIENSVADHLISLIQEIMRMLSGLRKYELSKPSK